MNVKESVAKNHEKMLQEEMQQEVRPPGEPIAGETGNGEVDIADGHTAAPKKIFVCSPYRPHLRKEG